MVLIANLLEINVGIAMVLFRSILVFAVTGCASVQTDRAITTVQYITPLTIGIIAVQSFGSSN